jgi:ATP-binding cassette subfamily B protein
MAVTLDELSDDAGEERRGSLSILREGWAVSPELRQGAALTILLAVVGAGGRLVMPILLQQAIDHGLNGADTKVGLVLRYVAYAAAFEVVAATCQRFAVKRLGFASERALFGLRTRTFDHLQKLSIADHAEQRRGALVARVTSDIERLSQFFAWGGLAWLINTALMATVVSVMMVYDWRLALIALVVASPVLFLLRAVQRHLVAAYDNERARVSDYLGAVSEVIAGAPVVRAYRMQGRLTAEVRAAITARRRAADRAAVIAAFLFPIGEVFSVLTVAAVVALGLAIGPAGGLTAGSLVAFVFLTNRFLEPIAEFTEVLDQTQTAVAGLRRVLDVLDTTIEIDEAVEPVELEPGPVTIELDSVTFRYRPRRGHKATARNALEGVSLRIEAGSSVAVVGSTGSGKSTLAKLVARLADPTEGTVLVNGHDLRSVSFSSLRRAVLLVPQEPFLFNTTVVDNVVFARPDLGRRAASGAFAELGLTDWLGELGDGLDTEVGERGEHLSAGERQLVALARAQVMNPPCLILDEATSSVDPGTEARLARAVVALARGRTTITIAHRLSTAMRADRILVIERGKLVEDGPHGELLQREGRYAELFADWVRATGG